GGGMRVSLLGAPDGYFEHSRRRNLGIFRLFRACKDSIFDKCAHVCAFANLRNLQTALRNTFTEL
ncbi:MAG: hypothetical protein LBV47_02435, partial [Bacteroidales bacterium]|nr:hypothetical protein [Bacteroidales bacterium]